MLRLVAKHLGDIHVAAPVLFEVRQLDRASADDLGFHVVEPEFAILPQAANASARSPLRFEDWLCLLLAEQQRWTCVTNDKRLRNECEARDVTVMWGLQPLLRLAGGRALPVNDAIELAEAMQNVNKRIPRAVVDAFVKQVKKGR